MLHRAAAHRRSPPLTAANPLSRVRRSYAAGVARQAHNRGARGGRGGGPARGAAAVPQADARLPPRG